jgi:CubicO group peptidase (beta-lactamase class C family)
MWHGTTTIIAFWSVALAPYAGPVFAQVTKVQAKAPLDAISVTGERLPGLEHFDRDMIAFMRQYKIPGASMAIVKSGRLVYARGFGLADVDRQEPVLPTSLFRIASVSKTITAVTILHLIELGKLHRDDRVFNLLKLETKVPPLVEFDPRWKQITVSHLLRHEGGWDRGKSGEPINVGLDVLRFNQAAPPLTTDHIIRYMLARPLDFDPGQEYVYSNFGYCLLGRVVEAVTGRTYEDYVRDEILKPMGIVDMRVGKSLVKDRAPGEVRYYHQSEPLTRRSVFGPILGEPVPQPYGSACIEAMDSHGGWIASSVDLARFATALNPGSSYKALSSKAREMMFRRPSGPSGFEPGGKPKEVYYACGLSVRPYIEAVTGNAWHCGLLPGCSSALLRRHDGVNAAILVNKRDDSLGISGLAQVFLDDHLHGFVEKVSVWPRGNLFPKFAIMPERKPRPVGGARAPQVP